eukprot:3788273-Rhodomonas_salina.1
MEKSLNLNFFSCCVRSKLLPSALQHAHARASPRRSWGRARAIVVLVGIPSRHGFAHWQPPGPPAAFRCTSPGAGPGAHGSGRDTIL